jgi:hypothetical protein
MNPIVINNISITIFSEQANDNLDISHNFESKFEHTRGFVCELITKGLMPRIGESFSFHEDDYSDWSPGKIRLFNELFFFDIKKTVVVTNIIYLPKNKNSIEIILYIEKIKNKKKITLKALQLK